MGIVSNMGKAGIVAYSSVLDPGCGFQDVPDPVFTVYTAHAADMQCFSENLHKHCTSLYFHCFCEYTREICDFYVEQTFCAIVLL